MANQSSMVMEFYEFSPQETVTVNDVINLFKAMNLTLHQEAWDRLPEETRKQFIVRKRNGESYRYGKDPAKRRPLNQR